MFHAAATSRTRCIMIQVYLVVFPERMNRQHRDAQRPQDPIRATQSSKQIKIPANTISAQLLLSHPARCAIQVIALRTAELSYSLARIRMRQQ
jgi:hypothetical protein